jgi:uncharacterized membrane protein (UPF0127 family)
VVTRLALLVVALAVVLQLGVVAGANPTARLKLDATPFRPELAVTPAQRSLGLMNRRRAPADGMLFVFPENTNGGFWMKNTLVPLKIVFFDRAGRSVRRFVMQPCRTSSCRVYSPNRTYRFALELRATDRRPARRLGPLAELRRLVRRAS